MSITFVRRTRRLLLAIALLAGAAPAAAQVPAPVVVAIDEARFEPVDAARPDGPAIAVLRGNPATGPSDVLLKLKKTDGTPHTHSSAYRALLVSGRVLHYERCTCEAAAPLAPGSFWYQPGGVVHGDACLSDECVIYVSWEGPMDAQAAAPPAAR
jgi:hypothetical protein